MAVSGDRNERLFRIWRTLGSLSATPVDSPPPYPVLKNMIVELQLDIRTEVIELMRNGDYITAVMYLNHGINSSGLLRRGRSFCFTTVDAELLVLRSECANTPGYYQVAVQDAIDAIRINGDYSSAWVQLVKAKFNFACADGEVALAEFKDFLRCQVSEKHKKIPVIKDITARLENLLGPAVPHHRCRQMRGTALNAVKPMDEVLSAETKAAATTEVFESAPASKLTTNSKPLPPNNQQKGITCSKTLTAIPPRSATLDDAKSPLQGSPPSTAANQLGGPETTRQIAPISDTVAAVSVEPTVCVSEDEYDDNDTDGDVDTTASVVSSLEQIIPVFQHSIKYVCGICFIRQGGAKLVEQKAGCVPSVCNGAAVSHAWAQCKIPVMYSDSNRKWCEVKPRHPSLRPSVFPRLCQRGKSCTRSHCVFPHISEEINLWVYMADYKMTTLEEVIAAAEGPASPLADQESPQQIKQYDCSYCGDAFLTSWELQQHIQTPGHWSKVNSDTDKKDQWIYRDPPWDVVNGDYQECQENTIERCIYTGAHVNSCTKAHSPEELEEWKERHRYRIMKVKKAIQHKLYAFMDGVLQKYNSGSEVIAEELLGVSVACSGNLSQFLPADRNDGHWTYSWSFTIKPSDSKRLKRVCLLYDDNRLRFRLSEPAREREAQVCSGNLIVEDDGKTWQIDVIFQSQMLGSFSQWVLFDFGLEPYLVHKLKVQVGSAMGCELLDEMQIGNNNKVEVWNSTNQTISVYEDDYKLTNGQMKLLARYQIPGSLGIDDLAELSRDNYKDYMHRMLSLEEQACNEKISKFATECNMKCLDKIVTETLTGPVAECSRGGSKFGRVDLKKALMDDSETSQIIKNNVHKMMLRFGDSKKIYEATIFLNQDDMNNDNKDVVYVKLSPACVTELKLKKDTEYHVEIQLQLDRLPFCYMHSAVDGLQNLDMVFPPNDKSQKLPPLRSEYQGRCDPHQNQAMEFISNHGGPKACQMFGVGPLLICGPFGTGKTYTLALAVERTLQLRPDSRVLICTQSNSAADLYITEQLHRLVECGKIRKMIRLCAKYRNMRTISDTVRQYITINRDGNIQIPNTQKIKSSSVVVTTLATSHRLVSCELRGHFTHILIDEAGQALETETLQPLTLATEDTCVVLAGDHLQMRQKVFSQKARHAKYNTSLLERLFYHKVACVLLSSNYRTCPEVLEFVSQAFYCGAWANHQLKAIGHHEPLPEWKHPLAFYFVKGEDQKIGMSYVNQYEVRQIGLIAKDLYDTWPEEKLGRIDRNSIGIVTPYTMQVRQIRNELRKHSIATIDVGTVQIMQGKQFRVVIVTTVRTHNTLKQVVGTRAVASKIRPLNRSEDTFDYGFLSDPRLLNTAFTRAQSRLIVVGDPMALCSIGECSNIWRRYLTECEVKGTLFPKGTSVKNIRQEIESVKNRVNPCTTVYTTAAYTSISPPTIKHPVVSEVPHLDNVDSWLPKKDDNIPDGILREFYRQIEEDERMSEDASKNSETSESLAMSRKCKRATKFRMIQKNDRITLAFNHKTKSTENATEFLYEGGLKNDMHNEKERLSAFQKAKEMPHKYKMCTFHCDTSGHTYAVPLEERSSGKILITSKRRLGRALNLDEVIVEILDDDTEREVKEVAEDKKTCYGKVVCISKRAARSALNNNIVCKLDEHINNLMVPIDHTLPKLYVFSHNDGGGQRRTTGESMRSPDYTTVSIKRNINDEQFEFVKNVKVSRSDRKQKLFLVRYVEWMADNPYPVGVVTEDLPEGDNKETGLRILNLLCGVKEEWHPTVLATVERDFASGWSIPDSVIRSRYDARGIKVFTIDTPECDDIDDALSVELVDGNYEVGIHIADVSYFVKKDTLLDKEAKIRATSFYPPSGTPIGMLPDRLGNGLCSLLPDNDRLTVSVFITLDESGAVMGINKFMRSITRSCRKLNYATVETIINSRADERKGNSSVEEKIQTLSKLARARRSSRLGVGQHVFHHNPEEEAAQHPFAHSLVEEMMLLANQAVANFVMGKYPDCSPLRRQLAPSEENTTEWMTKHGKDVPNSLDLQSKTLLTMEQGDASDMKLLKEKWDELCAGVTSKEGHVKMTSVTDLITSDENHPRLAAAKVNYCLMQKASSYISTGNYPDQEMRKHHSLNMTAYTHFTSPIRRYFDIVVHRMLTAAIEDERAQDSCHRSEIPHTDSEIAAIAHNCNYQNFNSGKYEKNANALQYALILRECPLSFKVFVSGITDSDMDLFFPHRHFLSSDISLNLLKPTNRPDITEDSIQMELQWKERIFELSGSSTSTSQGSQRQQLPEKGQHILRKLDTNQMIVSIPAEQWQGILTSVQAQDLRMIQKAIANADNDRKLHEKAQRRQSVIKEVTCETGPGKNPKPLPFVNFKRHFERGDVIQVQLNGSMQMGILMPSIQLVYLTPKLNFCVEHRENPIESFSKVAAHRPPLRITDITRYKDMWLPILEMMSAYDAIRNDEACVLHGVDIEWKCCQEDNRPSRYSGKFTVKKMFCHYRNIRFNRGDYVCIRYSDLPLPPNTKHSLKRLGIVSTETGHSSTIDGERYTFVAHAVISNVNDIQAYTDNWTMAVQVAVNQHSAPFPDALVIPNPKVTLKCAVELILKESTDRRLITAVNHLNCADQLIKDICLHHKPSVDKTDPVMTRLLQASSQIGRLVIPGSPYANLNNPQQKAIRLALQQQFTIIQGPPGTGKTITGAYLAYFFTEVNKQLPSNSDREPQVLYCGPSNKSVDVVGGYLLHLGIPVIRVYSKLVEQQVYPIPGHSYKVSKLGDSQEAKMDPGLKHTSLHHLIRNSPNSGRDSILRFDRRCQKRDHAISFQELLEYRKIVRKAEADVLRRFKVVLCTCSEAGSRRIQDLNVIQCIVDEAGMCSEPETLIPLVGTSNGKKSRKDPRQVVLIGDHKQLRPIIQERTAVHLGMEISLLEKYEEKATMLTIQYRMHESICAFPSEVFYRGMLVTDASVKQRKPHFETIWPGARRDPLVFCHHVGVEESQSVRTEEGNEQSRANMQEVKHVVRIASVMVKQLGVKQDDVVILTQYRLQKAQITEKMAELGLKGVAVSTVITSQGREWDYVILSTVRSLPRVEIDDKPSPSWKRRNLGFITDENQMNVAITRARLGLIILGNRYLLGVHDTWNRLLNHYWQMNAVVHADQFLKAYNLRK